MTQISKSNLSIKSATLTAYIFIVMTTHYILTQKSPTPSATTEFKCNLTLKYLGCYRDKMSPRPLPVQLMVVDDAAHPGDIGWRDFLPRFICKCANEARNFTYWTIGIQNYHKCFSGPDEGRYDEDGPARDGACKDENGKNCGEQPQYCAGEDGTNAVFTVITPEHKEVKRIEND